MYDRIRSIENDLNGRTIFIVSLIKDISNEIDFDRFPYSLCNSFRQKQVVSVIVKFLIALSIVVTLLYTTNALSKSFEFVYSKKISPGEIGVLVVADDTISNRFDQHLASLTCYTRRHAYQLIRIHPKQYPACLGITKSIYFQKHCLVLMYLTDNTHIRWLLVLDIDVLVMNISKKIESYLPNAISEPSMHLILREKFNGEIAAGNFLIHNHPWSREFLSTWLQFERQTRHMKFHNHDIGSLHLHLLGSLVGKVDQFTYDRCFQIYNATIDHSMYHRYIGCCKCALGGRWEFDHVRILRRGHSFTRDGLGSDSNQRIWSPMDFFLHTHVANVSEYYSAQINATQCLDSNWTVPIREEFVVKDFTQLKELVRKYDREAAEGYPQSVGLPDISDCWPSCADTEARRQAFLERVCNQNASST